jgi:NAD(P)-dependent dehydrogenase (short-subunit alcohol dehydrogenase family)
MGSLAGHVALVTGGTRGIGRAIALRLAREGASLAIVGRSGGSALEIAKEQIVNLGVACFGMRADVSERKQVEELFARAAASLGTVDILVNNAAVSDPAYTSGWELREEEWDRMCGVNLKGVFLCCAAAVPGMIEKGWGRIINISSTSGISGGTSGIHYAATKGGVNALSKALAHEVAARGVTVNVVAPSKIDTDMFRSVVDPDKRQDVIDKIPVNRLGRPEDIAEAVAYFAREEAGYTTGQVLVVSGGY